MWAEVDEDEKDADAPIDDDVGEEDEEDVTEYLVPAVTDSIFLSSSSSNDGDIDDVPF